MWWTRDTVNLQAVAFAVLVCSKGPAFAMCAMWGNWSPHRVSGRQCRPLLLAQYFSGLRMARHFARFGYVERRNPKLAADNVRLDYYVEPLSEDDLFKVEKLKMAARI